MQPITIQVWDALRRPPIHHPLFRRITRSRRPIPAPPRPAGRSRQIALIAFLLGFVVAILRFYTQGILVVVFVLPLALTAIYVTLYGSLRGLYAALNVSSAITREHQRGVYELAALSPAGAFSVSWAICTGCQYYDQTFNEIAAQRVWFFRIFFLALLLFGALAGFSEARLSGIVLLRAFANVSMVTVVMLLAFHVDDIHSTVIGSLVGLIVPMIAQQRLDARIGALSGFLLLQVIAYGIFWVIGFTIMPDFNTRLPIGEFAAALVLPLEQLLIFFAVRELMARVLWRIYAFLLDGDVGDLHIMTRGGQILC